MSDPSSCDGLWGFLDEDLGPAGSVAFRKHLACCAACRVEVDDHQAIAESLRWSESFEPPTSIRDRLMAEFRRIHRPTAPDGIWRRWSYALRMRISVPAWAAALILGVLGIAYVASGGTTPGPAPAPTQVGVGSGSAPERVTYRVVLPDGTVRNVTRTTIFGAK